MMEAGVLLGANGEPIFWHTPNARSVGYLPDDRDLWQVIWENRKNVTGFAHTHPGSGLPGPSHTDITTFAAIESALGKQLNWFILSSDSAVLCLFNGKDGYIVTVNLTTDDDVSKLTWMNKLRELSNYNNSDLEQRMVG